MPILEHRVAVPSSALPSQNEHVLLINPAVFDTQFHWSAWQQPTNLLRLSTYCRQVGADVKLIDALATAKKEKITRKQIETLPLDGVSVKKWRFGLARVLLKKQMHELSRANWFPDKVYVDGFTTIWWQGVQEAIECAKECFPHSQVVLFGTYPSEAPDHAKAHTEADEIVPNLSSSFSALQTDFSLYDNVRKFAYISLDGGRRTSQEVVQEIVDKATQFGVTQFAFEDHAVIRDFNAIHKAVLQELVDRKRKPKFYAFGNIYPSDLVRHPDLAALMKTAGYRQIYFADDRDTPVGSSGDTQLVEDYQNVALICAEAGFARRSDALVAALSLGRANEDIADRTKIAAKIAHSLGALIFWPYQPSSNQCPDTALENRNGKLFPLRHHNGYEYGDYSYLLGLGVVMNSKHRTQTFDFMGDGIMSTLFRQSLSREAWNPDPAIKGSIKLRMVKRG